MAREWEPGDVVVSNTISRGPRFLVRQRSARYPWLVLDDMGGGVGEDNVPNPRRAVLLDPEDREQVERLLTSLQGMSFAPHACGAFTCLQAALREFANPTPPKPDEPSLWGVVEAHVDGIPRRRWVHHEEDRWVCDTGEWRYWEDLQEPVVVREGVQP